MPRWPLPIGHKRSITRVVRCSQEPEPIGKDLENALGEDQTVLLRLRLQYLENELLLAQAAHVLDVQVARDDVEVRDALFLQLGKIHPGHFGVLRRTSLTLASFSAGAHQKGSGRGDLAPQASG